MQQNKEQNLRKRENLIHVPAPLTSSEGSLVQGSLGHVEAFKVLSKYETLKEILEYAPEAAKLLNCSERFYVTRACYIVSIPVPNDLDDIINNTKKPTPPKQDGALAPATQSRHSQLDTFIKGANYKDTQSMVGDMDKVMSLYQISEQEFVGRACNLLKIPLPGDPAVYTMVPLNCFTQIQEFIKSQPPTLTNNIQGALFHWGSGHKALSKKWAESEKHLGFKAILLELFQYGYIAVPVMQVWGTEWYDALRTGRSIGTAEMLGLRYSEWPDSLFPAYPEISGGIVKFVTKVKPNPQTDYIESFEHWFDKDEFEFYCSHEKYVREVWEAIDVRIRAAFDERLVPKESWGTYKQPEYDLKNPKRYCFEMSIEYEKTMGIPLSYVDKMYYLREPLKVPIKGKEGQFLPPLLTFQYHEAVGDLLPLLKAADPNNHPDKTTAPNKYLNLLAWLWLYCDHMTVDLVVDPRENVKRLIALHPPETRKRDWVFRLYGDGKPYVAIAGIQTSMEDYCWNPSIRAKKALSKQGAKASFH